MTEPDPKIYAPFITQLENEHPALAPLLVGIGDEPYPSDLRKTLVSAHFQTEAGSRFSGRYITEPATSSPDAKAFLAAMVKKYQGVAATDKKVLGEKPARALGEQGAVGPGPGPTGVVPVQAEPEPEPATPPDEDDDAEWGTPGEPGDPSSERP